MGASSQTDLTGPRPAALIASTAPDVSVERGDDGDVDSVTVSGVMYHSGLNANAWGLTKAGATAIANDLIDQDYTAAHPFIRAGMYDRSVVDGPGSPVGEVQSTEVVSVDDAMLDGGEYTASYSADVVELAFARKLANGLRTGGKWGTSVGIYADPSTANCNICGNLMNSEECDHRRGETVEIRDGDDSETKVAGPLYDDGESDHLAHVWIPAYENASVEVDSAATTGTDASSATASYASEGASVVRSAEAVLAEPFDPVTEAGEAGGESEPVEASAGRRVQTRYATPTTDSDATHVELDQRVVELSSQRRGRGSTETRSNHGR